MSITNAFVVQKDTHMLQMSFSREVRVFLDKIVKGEAI